MCSTSTETGSHISASDLSSLAESGYGFDYYAKDAATAHRKEILSLFVEHDVSPPLITGFFEPHRLPRWWRCSAFSHLILLIQVESSKWIWANSDLDVQVADVAELIPKALNRDSPILDGSLPRYVFYPASEEVMAQLRADTSA